jgi:hypothetical protein
MKGSVDVLSALAAAALMNSFVATRTANVHRPAAATSFQTVNVALFQRLALRLLYSDSRLVQARF